MAKQTAITHYLPTKVKRKGVHAKSKQSTLKTSKNYVKKKIGQG
jgi:hypothetical protein